MIGLAHTTFSAKREAGRRRVWLRCGWASLLVLVSTAGWGQSGSSVSAPLQRPTGVAFDTQGDLYIAETNNQAIRRVTPAGAMTTVAGSGVQGFGGDGGPAVLAQLDSPAGVAVDAAQNLYLADTHNHRIRRVDVATGTITTIAGTGMAGYAGDRGPATAAKLCLPTALAVDGAGDVYFSDSGNHRIREIVAATGVVVTVAGNGVQGYAGDGGPATAAEIDSPDGLAVNATGWLYLADTHNQRIRMVDPALGTITTLAGTGMAGDGGDGAAAAAASLAMPRGVVVDAAGNVYVADMANHRIRRIDGATGIVTTVAGDGLEGFSGDNGAAIAASLDLPRSVAVASGQVTLADTSNARVRQVTASGAIETIVGLGGTVPESLTIAGPAVIGYGQGTVTATLASAVAGAGQVQVLDTSGSAPVTVGTAVLSGGSAIVSTVGLSAGTHLLVATYAGDPTHAAAQSVPLPVTVTPAPVVAVVAGVTAVFGTAIPPLTGTVTGVLPQDADAVMAVFSSSAEMGSAAGSYPIMAALQGSAAGNYTVGMGPGSGAVTITQAATLATLTPGASGISVGQATNLTAVVSATSGVPVGSMTLLDGGALLSQATLSPSGVASFNVSFSTAGTHNLTAVYLGNLDFLPTASAPVDEMVVAGSGETTTGGSAATDFALASSGTTSQTVAAGTTASYGFTVSEQGSGMPSPVVLSATGLPLGATASFSPAYVPPGASSTAVTLTIQTPSAALRPPDTPGTPRWPQEILAGMWLACVLGPQQRRRLGGRELRWGALAVLWLGLAGLSGCGNRMVPYSGAPEVVNTSYSITVTGAGTSTSGAAVTHAATVTLVVQAQ